MTGANSYWNAFFVNGHAAKTTRHAVGVVAASMFCCSMLFECALAAVAEIIEYWKVLLLVYEIDTACPISWCVWMCACVVCCVYSLTAFTTSTVPTPTP